MAGTARFNIHRSEKASPLISNRPAPDDGVEISGIGAGVRVAVGTRVFVAVAVDVTVRVAVAV